MESISRAKHGIAGGAALPGRTLRSVWIALVVFRWTAASGNPRKRTQSFMALIGSELGLPGALDR